MRAPQRQCASYTAHRRVDGTWAIRGAATGDVVAVTHSVQAATRWLNGAACADRSCGWHNPTGGAR